MKSATFSLIFVAHSVPSIIFCLLAITENFALNFELINGGVFYTNPPIISEDQIFSKFSESSN